MLARHPVQRVVGQHPRTGALPAGTQRAEVGDSLLERVGVGLHVVARLDQPAAVLVDELEVAGQRGGDDGHAHRERLVDHVRHALEDAGHQQHVGAGVPARHALGRRVQAQVPLEPQLRGAARELALQWPSPTMWTSEVDAAPGQAIDARRASAAGPSAPPGGRARGSADGRGRRRAAAPPRPGRTRRSRRPRS